MIIIRLVKLLLLLTLATVVLSSNELKGDCTEIGKLISEEKPEGYFLDDTLIECVVNDEGKLDKM